ncbi:MAG: hypothetical protein RL591_518, partial [Planctomycetota bacterium]
MTRSTPHERQFMQATPSRVRQSRHRRGFSLVEMLIALAISAALLVAVLSALVASFRAYQATTEQ